MRFCCLGSGSGGNAYVVEHTNTTLLVDCGFSLTDLKKRLAARFLSLSEITAVIISHEHGDHVKCLNFLLKETVKPVYMTAGTAQAISFNGNWTRLQAGTITSIGDLQLLPVTVPHDAAEPVQFVFDNGSQRLGLFTDLGHVTTAVRNACHNLHALIVEYNYAADLLAANHRYPQRTKARIAGRLGHLENSATAELISQIQHPQLKHVVAAHLSAHNNTKTRVIQSLSAVANGIATHIADQQEGVGWLNIINRPYHPLT
ncbi:MBL fold metallo-hydrolase [Candidatus Persebacteraceae bacterium Df01]|jgi:phosphoribosyl 1,2-cyclic phosphodiesterase|uniref:MBL fold metallo-hydrolase n=1 Tax=Candidatus Doriopsillibacter californiensis TaxID=2970740 RepID=A0ABT7QMZ0_9GAMM|nr:MBL fold metallo-hydrolase [Candidatus Persebacteraceae bacterium Df01]